MDGSSYQNGPRLVGHIVEPLVERLSVLAVPANKISRRYTVEGREIIASTGRRMTPPQARSLLTLLVEDSLAVRDEITAEIDRLMINDLIVAIREAERNDPLPPAAAALRAA